MAPLATMTSIVGNAYAASRPTLNRRSMVVVAKQQVNAEEKVSGRRAIMLGVAAAAVVAAGSIQRSAFADEPKPGTPEAKKKYASICVTMPTAKICRN
jgi:hypothetical protein